MNRRIWWLRGRKRRILWLRLRGSLTAYKTAGLEVGQFGHEGEVQCDKGVLIAEVMKLRQEQAMEDRIAATEQKQQQTTVFLARAIKSPSFLQLFVGRQDQQTRRRELSKKRRRPPIEYLLPRDGESSNVNCMAGGTPKKLAPTVGISVDHRRKNRSLEGMQAQDLQGQACYLPKERSQGQGVTAGDLEAEEDVAALEVPEVEEEEDGTLDPEVEEED